MDSKDALYEQFEQSFPLLLNVKRLWPNRRLKMSTVLINTVDIFFDKKVPFAQIGIFNDQIKETNT